MKRIAQLVLVVGIALVSPVTFGADEHHPDEAKKGAVASKPAPKGPGAVAGGDQAGMQQGMKKMQDQMDRIRKTTDPKERQKLLDEHHQTMMENMKAMRGMGGSMMMGGDQKGGPMKGETGGRAGSMEQRMDMMQMMMEHMMQREQMRAPTK